MAHILNFPNCRGPFYIESGRDGVDDTFNVISYATQKTVATTRYWDEQDHARSNAKVICTALNVYCCGMFEQVRANSRLIDQFRLKHAGPFELRFEPEPFPSFLIYDQTTSEVVHDEYGMPGSTSELNARVIVEALNRLMS